MYNCRKDGHAYETKCLNCGHVRSDPYVRLDREDYDRIMNELETLRKTNPPSKRETALANLVLPYLEHPDVVEATKGMVRDSVSIAHQIKRECGL